VVILAAVGGFVVASLAVTLAIWLVARLGGTRPTICIIFGEGVPFDTFRNRLHSRERRIRVCVENRSRSQKLTNCFLELTSISGALAPRCPIKIKSDFTLNPHSEVYVAIASFKETGSKPAVSDLIRLYFPINELSDGRSYLEDASPHELCFTASAAESAPHIKNAILWIDGGVLKLEETRE
jgi:hypothetical protein